MERVLGRAPLRGRGRGRRRSGALHDDSAERRAESRVHGAAAALASRSAGAHAVPARAEPLLQAGEDRRVRADDARDRRRPSRAVRRCGRRRHLRGVHPSTAGVRLRPLLRPDARARPADPRGDARVRRRRAAVRHGGREGDQPRPLRHRTDDHRDAPCRATRPRRRPRLRTARRACRRRAAAGRDGARDDQAVHRRRHGRSLCLHREHGRPPGQEPRSCSACSATIPA